MIPELPSELVDQLKFIVENSSRFDRPQSFPFFPDDWLGSPGILTAHPAVEGGYIHLLAIEWGEVDLWLPSDPDRLATSSRLNSEWPKYAEQVLRFFYKHPFREGLVNHKLVEIRAKQLSYASRGQAGGLAKALADGKLDPKLGATPHPLPLPLPESPCPSKEVGASGEPDAPAVAPKRRGRQFSEPERAAVRAWVKLFADCYREVNNRWPTGYEPDSTRWPEPKVANAALALHKSGIGVNGKAKLLAVLRGEFYATPPANLAEFKAQYDRLTDANRKDAKRGQPAPVKSKYDQYRTVKP